MPHASQIADNYLATWNEIDPARRQTQLCERWAQTARYADPMMQGEGRDEVGRLIAGVQDRFPGHRFSLVGQPDGHGRFVRFCWALGPDGGTPIARGTDVVQLDEADRITTVIGFLDAP